MIILPRFKRDFFLQPTLQVAQSLLGQLFCFDNKHALITETEAYIGQDDPACHAACGKTKRNAAMYLVGGHLYVYLIYGIHHCINITTEAEGFPAAILIRGLQYIPSDNKTIISSPQLNGPGKLTKEFGISLIQNGWDITNHPRCSLHPTDYMPPYYATQRIGISKGQDKYWRFVTI